MPSATRCCSAVRPSRTSASYWPIQSDDQTGITDYLNDVAKYVVSTTMTDPQWKNSTVIAGDPVRRVRELKAEPGKDIVLTGSISLAHTLTAAGVVDEYRLMVFPVVQGRGRRLFPDGVSMSDAGVGRAAEVVSFGHHAAALRGGLKP